MVLVRQTLPVLSAAMWNRSALPVGLSIPVHFLPFHRCTSPRSGAAQTRCAGSMARERMDQLGRCLVQVFPSQRPTPSWVGDVQIEPSAACTTEVAESVGNGQGSVPQLP